jgi:hypothetical protein
MARQVTPLTRRKVRWKFAELPSPAPQIIYLSENILAMDQTFKCYIFWPTKKAMLRTSSPAIRQAGANRGM